MILFCSLILYIGSISTVYMTRLKNSRHIYLILTIGLLSFLSAVRASSVGNDTVEYLNVFSGCKYIEMSFFGMRYEIGYVLLNKILYSISTNPQIILIVSSIIIGIGFYTFIYKYSVIPMFSVFLFFTFGYWGQMMNTIRQSLAIVILLWAFDFVRKRKLLPFVLVVLLAMLFHRTAIIFLIAYPLSFIKVNIRIFLISLIAAISGLFFLEPIINKLLMIFPTYSYYLGSAYLDGNVRLATILNIIIVCLILCFGLILNKNPEKSELMSGTRSINASQSFVMNQKDFEIISMFLLVSIVISMISLKFNLLDRVGN